LHDKYKKENEDYKINMKINYLDYVRKFKLFITRYEDYKIRSKNHDSRTNDIEMVKLHKEFSDKIDLLAIKDNIKLIE